MKMLVESWQTKTGVEIHGTEVEGVFYLYTVCGGCGAAFKNIASHLRCSHGSCTIDAPPRTPAVKRINTVEPIRNVYDWFEDWTGLSSTEYLLTITQGV